jgi:FtsP/CotA-like multicopper oxidase with cupredoxin domain
MTRFTRLCRAVGVGLAVVTATLSMTQAAHAEPAAPALPPVAKNIAAPAGNKVFLVGRATGVQIYECTGSEWRFVAPRADLVGDNGKLVTTHFAGPTWQAKDGSTARGSVKERATVDATAIPWLLLNATGSAGPDGDRLARTTFIQRVNTVGGLAPTDVCNTSTAGTVKEVPYKADYFFYKATGAA